jgi:MFS family permease
MISDLFPRERITFAMSVYALGATIGSGTALMLGGAIIYWVSTFGDIVLPILGPVAQWQMVFFIVGLPGLLFAFVVFTFPEPLRRGRIGTSVVQGGNLFAPFAGLFRFVRGHVRFFAAHYAGFTIAVAVVSGCAGWYPVHLMRAHEWSQGQVGAWLGMTLLVAGIIGKLIGGLSVDAMYRRGYRDAQLRWFACCLLLAAPTGVYAATSGNPWAFLVMIGVFTILLTPLQACAMSSLNLVTPNRMRGTGVAVYSTVAGLLGGSVGAMAVPMLAQLYAEPDTAIGNGMATLIGLTCPLAALALFSGMKAMRKAMALEEAEGNG